MAKAAVDLLAKVQKLLALSTSSNVHEAAAALHRAQALIDQHQLQDLLDATASDADIDDGRSAPLEVAQRPRRWRRVLAEGLAHENGGVVWSFVDADGATALCFCGRTDDRAVVQALFDWLARTLEWLSASAGPGKSRQWHEAFRVGAADVVVDRLVAGDVDHADSGLVRVDAARAARRARAEEFATRHLPLARSKGFLVDARGFAQGKRLARDLPLSKPKR